MHSTFLEMGGAKIFTNLEYCWGGCHLGGWLTYLYLLPCLPQEEFHSLGDCLGRRLEVMIDLDGRNFPGLMLYYLGHSLPF